MCYCGSSHSYEDCCQVFHNGNSKATSALALMRSRYSAYVVKNIDYLVSTTHPDLDPVYEDLEAWANFTTWKKLEIVSSSFGRKSDHNGEVEFKATYIDGNGKTHVHHERSKFQKENNEWLYSAGTINPKALKDTGKTGRNDPCPCGSGKKFKKCCASE